MDIKITKVIGDTKIELVENVDISDLDTVAAVTENMVTTLKYVMKAVPVTPQNVQPTIPTQTKPQIRMATEKQIAWLNKYAKIDASNSTYDEAFSAISKYKEDHGWK